MEEIDTSGLYFPSVEAPSRHEHSPFETRCSSGSAVNCHHVLCSSSAYHSPMHICLTQSSADTQPLADLALSSVHCLRYLVLL